VGEVRLPKVRKKEKNKTVAFIPATLENRRTKLMSAKRALWRLERAKFSVYYTEGGIKVEVKRTPPLPPSRLLELFGETEEAKKIRDYAAVALVKFDEFLNDEKRKDRRPYAFVRLLATEVGEEVARELYFELLHGGLIKEVGEYAEITPEGRKILEKVKRG